MLLTLEVGNTNTKVGVYEGSRLVVSWRLTTRREQTADEYGLFIETLLRTRGLTPASIHGAAISNVVPPVQQALEWACDKYFGVTPLSVEPGVNTPIPLNVDHPREVGARQAGIGAQHGQHHELRRGHAEVGQRALHCEPRRGTRGKKRKPIPATRIAVLTVAETQPSALSKPPITVSRQMPHAA